MCAIILTRAKSGTLPKSSDRCTCSATAQGSAAAAGKAKGGGDKSVTPTEAEHIRRYIKEYEIVVSPLHARLQRDFKAHLKRYRFHSVRKNVACVDRQYRDPKRGTILVEEPCDVGQAGLFPAPSGFTRICHAFTGRCHIIQQNCSPRKRSIKHFPLISEGHCRLSPA